MSFSEKLKIIRKKENLSQEQLAEMLNISRQAVSKWELGTGYPETEKLLAISQKFNVSLDYLMLDKEKISDEKISINQNKAPQEKIAIKTYDGESVVFCYKVSVTGYFPSKNSPKYILNGVDGISFWGEHTTQLGWYAEEEDIKKEVEEISQAIINGESYYELKYFAKVNVNFFGVTLDNTTTDPVIE